MFSTQVLMKCTFGFFILFFLTREINLHAHVFVLMSASGSYAQDEEDNLNLSQVCNVPSPSDMAPLHGTYVHLCLVYTGTLGESTHNPLRQ